MKKSQVVLSIVALLFAGLVTGGAIYAVANHFLHSASAVTECKGDGKSISVIIQNNVFSDQRINGVLCDTLTIINRDDSARLMAFGDHDNHTPYDGVTEKLLQKDESFTITLNKTGTYEIHDHLADEAKASFTVTRQ